MQSLDEILIKDKFVGLEQVAQIMKEEITPLAQEFFVLGDDVVVRFRKENSRFVFNVEIVANRIKPFGHRM